MNLSATATTTRASKMECNQRIRHCPWMAWVDSTLAQMLVNPTSCCNAWIPASDMEFGDRYQLTVPDGQPDGRNCDDCRN